MSSPAGPSNPSTSSFNFSTAQAGPSSAQRRPLMQQQGISGMGGLGGSMRPPGKSGLTFDHILSRLQGELQKSRETGAELHSLTGAMGDIHDTLGGALVCSPSSFLTRLRIYESLSPPTFHHIHPLYPLYVQLTHKRNNRPHRIPIKPFLYLPLANYRPNSTRPNLLSPLISIRSVRLKAYLRNMKR
jgi:hypothetical protein